MKLSIVTANWWAEDWAKFLVKSVKENTSTDDYEIIIVDNSHNLGKIDGAKIIKPSCKLNHSRGLNFGIWQASGDYILVLDIDAFIMLKNWDNLVINYFKKNQLELIACQGGKLKPIRPCGMFFKRDMFISKQMNFDAMNIGRISFDVGMLFYFSVLSVFGDKKVDYFPYHKTEFKDVVGSEYLFEGQRFIYHNYYSTRFFNVDGKRVHNKINNMTWENLVKCKNNLFKQI